MATHAEYIRDGLNWQVWVNNLSRLCASKKIRNVHVMATINALCLESLPEFLDLLLWLKQIYGKNAPSFTLNILRFPSFQSPLVLPDHIRTHHRDRLQAWLDHNRDHSLLQEHELNHTQRLIDYLDVVKTPHSEAFELPKLLNDFHHFYRQYDQRRQKDFVSTFPHLADWYQKL
jgi:hypothetical protein